MYAPGRLWSDAGRRRGRPVAGRSGLRALRRRTLNGRIPVPGPERNPLENSDSGRFPTPKSFPHPVAIPGASPMVPARIRDAAISRLFLVLVLPVPWRPPTEPSPRPPFPVVFRSDQPLDPAPHGLESDWRTSFPRCGAAGLPRRRRWWMGRRQQSRGAFSAGICRQPITRIPLQCELRRGFPLSLVPMHL